MNFQAWRYSHCPHNPCNEDEQGQLGWHGVGMAAVISRAKTDCRKTRACFFYEACIYRILGRSPHLHETTLSWGNDKSPQPWKGELGVYLFPTPPWCPDFLYPALSLGEISRSFIHCLKRLTHISMPGRVVHQPHLCSDIRQWRGPVGDAVT